MKKVIIFMALAFLILPAVSADVITPGYSPITINNQITNYEDFPEYVFVSLGIGPMCDFDIIENGVIMGQYKFCDIEVYAIEKSKFNPEDVPRNEYGEMGDWNKVEVYLADLGAVKVIENIKHYKEKHISDPIREVNNQYTIDLNKVLKEPSNTDKEKDWLLYLYIIIPIVVLVIIIFIIIKKRRK